MSLAPSRGDRPELQKPPIATELAGSDIPVAEERAHHAERHD